MVASAGWTVASGTLTQVGAGVAVKVEARPEVEDVVPLLAADPQPTVVGGLAFPLVFGGILSAVAFRSLLTGQRWWILSGIVLFSLVGGLIVS